ncbi:TolA protein [Lelliottia jeotgali]|nr:TolA protein [Lelliottia jeotgali]
MSEVTDLTVIEIKAEQAPALYKSGGLDDYLEQIRQAVNEVPDLSTKKGRDRVASLAASVSRSKTAIEKPGREYLKRLKEAVRPAEAEIKRFVDACDELRDATRRPLTEWEAEQERIKAEEAAKIKADDDRKKFESDHEIALLMNDKHDREVAEKKAEAERQRIAHEEELKRQAAEQAKREAEEKAAAELAAAKKREDVAIAARAQAELLAKQEREHAEYEAAAAAARAEREKQEAIEAEKRKAQEEADRIKREAEQKEAARLAEEKRIADEKAKREADVKHRKAVGTEIVNALTANTSISREQAIEVLKALMDGLVPRTQINY